MGRGIIAYWRLDSGVGTSAYLMVCRLLIEENGKNKYMNGGRIITGSYLRLYSIPGPFYLPEKLVFRIPAAYVSAMC